jgi:Zn-dependent protease
MRWSYRIARVAGIDVNIHVTFLLLLAWFGAISWRSGGAAGAVQGVGFTLLLFLCVLLHEFGHAFAARAYGIRTPDITLLPIGGVARLERMPDKPIQELVVAVAGPAVNVVIAFLLVFVLAAKVSLASLAGLDGIGSVDGSLTANLLAVNLMLVAFNAIPAFPMDGGRVLRALLAMKMNHLLATTIAARVGQVLALGFAVASLTGYGSPMLLFIALFVFAGAQQELAYARFRAGG